jgi:tetratricopeptide (TPR) repeat protein
MSHTHGQVIRKYRKLAYMSLKDLGRCWHASGVGVGANYIQDVESGRKVIVSQTTLRRLAGLLSIPLWEFGLSEWDPFSETYTRIGGRTMIDFSLGIAEALLEQAWRLKNTESSYLAEKALSILFDQYAYMEKNSPPTVTQSREFKHFAIQLMRLKAGLLIDRKQYSEALDTFRNMLKSAIDLNDPTQKVFAYIGIGWELDRAGKYEDATEALEQARDVSFLTGKALASVAYSYLSRVYAHVSDEKRHERILHVALELSTHLGSSYMSTEDNTFFSMSDISGAGCTSYLDIGKVSEASILYKDFERQVLRESSPFEFAGLSLVQARIHLMQDNLEYTISDLREYFKRSEKFQSEHLKNRGLKIIREMKQKGYAEEKKLLELEEEFTEMDERSGT